MTLEIHERLLAEIHQHGQAAYPEEAAGMLIGSVERDRKRVLQRLELQNSREHSTRHNRYLINAEDYLRAEQEAARHALDVIGVYHSHPDHPNRPSEFDREWAMPWFSYLITSVQSGYARGSRAWLLAEDRSSFTEEAIILILRRQPKGD